MSKKLFLLIVAIFAVVFVINAQENETVEQENIAETEEVAPGDKAEEKAEIKEIDAEEKAKEEQADAEIKDEGQNEVAKEIAEDKAAGKEEAKIEAEEAKKEADAEPAAEGEANKEAEEKPAAEAKVEVVEEPKVEEKAEDTGTGKSGSWFSWLWPFSSSKPAEEAAPAAVEAAPAEAPAVEAPVAEAVPAAEKPAEEAAPVAVEAKPAEEAPAAAPAEPKVETEAGKGKGGSFMRAALLYLPNVLLNLTDIISTGVGVGAEAGAEVHLTRWCQVGGQYGDAYFIEKGFDRRFGGGYDNGYSFGLVALSSEKRYVDKTFGGVEEFIIKDSKATIFSPNDPVYQTKKRDFWAIGVDAGWLINVRVDFHPVELADFLASLIALDITGDNLK